MTGTTTLGCRSETVLWQVEVQQEAWRLDLEVEEAEGEEECELIGCQCSLAWRRCHFLCARLFYCGCSRERKDMRVDPIIILAGIGVAASVASILILLML